MKMLHLNLKGRYWDDIACHWKKYEYRLYDEYWKKRILNKTFAGIILKRGYPKRDDTKRHLTRPWRGFKIITITHPEFGPKSVTVFAIRVND